MSAQGAVVTGGTIGRRAFVAGALWSLVGIAGVFTSCLLPVYTLGGLHKLFTVAGLKTIYSLGNSNIDVLILIVMYTLIAAGISFWLVQYSRKGETPYRPAPGALLSLSVISKLTICILLGKTVIVAMLASSSVRPTLVPGGMHTGLLYLFLSMAMASFSVLSLWRCGFRLSEALDASVLVSRRDGINEPLLSGVTQSADAETSEIGKGHERKPSAILQLIMMTGPDKYILMAAFTCGLLAAFGQALIPYYTGKSIAAASLDKEASEKAFHDYVKYLVLAGLGTAIFTAIRGGCFTVVSARLNRRIRIRLFDNLMQQEIGFFDKTKTGDITSRLSADTSTMSDQISLNLNVFARSIMQATILLIFMILANWRMTVITFILVPVNIQICTVYGRYFRSLVKAMQTALAEANVVADEAIGTMLTVRAHAAERNFQDSYAAQLLTYYVLTLKSSLAYALYLSIDTFLPMASAAIVLLYGGHLVFDNEMTGDQLISFMLYQQSLASSLGNIGDVFTALASAVGAADKVLEMLNRKPQENVPGSLQQDEFSGRLDLNNVHFSYPARSTVKVLNGVDLVVNPGEIVALVGMSGSGKSSIVKLIERFYLPSEGEVLIDGRDVGEWDASWLKRKVAIVGQEPVLYGRSIHDNIVLGLDHAECGEDGDANIPTRDEVIAAAKLSNAHDFIMTLPEGYDTQCGDRGASLSGGQKQRIAIARALVRKPSVLLLDEATSALDTESEALVQDALESVMHGRTVLVIAHRLSTIQNADRIIVMSEGKVVETGSPAELQAANGAYSSLVRRQMRSPSCASMTSAVSMTMLNAIVEKDAAE